MAKRAKRAKRRLKPTAQPSPRKDALRKILKKKSIVPVWAIASFVVVLVVVALLLLIPQPALQNIPPTPEEIHNNTAFNTAPTQSQPIIRPSQPKTPAQEIPLEIIATVTRPAIILGKNGFQPTQMTIDVGDSITWSNEDPGQREVVLTFQKDKLLNKIITSPIIKVNTEWEYTFTEAGTYEYWTVAYGRKGKIVVRS